MNRPNREGARARRALTVGVLLVVTILLAVSVVPRVRTAHRTAQLQAATSAAYHQTRPAVDQRRRAAGQVLAGILGSAAFHSAAVSCRLDEDYAGLLVQNWEQVCTIRTLDVYSTTLSYPALAAQLNSAAAANRTSTEETLGASIPGQAPGTAAARHGATPPPPRKRSTPRCAANSCTRQPCRRTCG